MALTELIARAIAEGGQNLHITKDREVKARISGLFADMGSILEDDFTAFLGGVLDDRNRAELNKVGSTTAMMTVDGVLVRVHVYYSAAKEVAALRFHRDEVLSPEQLGIPPDIVNLTDAQSGWVLLSGPQGSGKTTTLAALAKYMADNASLPRHIVTVERPVEIRIPSGAGLVTHIEIPRDAPTLPAAMRSLLRLDAQAGLLGELRMEPEVASAFVDLVDAGMLVFANTHGDDPVRAIDRLLDTLPTEDRERGRRIIAHGMVASVGLRLVRDRDDKLVLITSVLHGSPATTAAIVEGTVSQLYSMLDAKPNRTFEQALVPLVPTRISPETAERALRSTDPGRGTR